MQNNSIHPLGSFLYCPRCGHRGFEINNVKSKKCVACEFIYYFNPSAAVACFLRNRADEVLVAVRALEPGRGLLDLPGGFVDSDETAEQTLRREVAEETGLKVGEMSYICSLPNIYPYSNFEVHTLDIFFECFVDSFEGATAADDVSELRVVKIIDLDPEKFAFRSIAKAIEAYKLRGS